LLAVFQRPLLATDIDAPGRFSEVFCFYHWALTAARRNFSLSEATEDYVTQGKPHLAS